MLNGGTAPGRNYNGVVETGHFTDGTLTDAEYTRSLVIGANAVMEAVTRFCGARGSLLVEARHYTTSRKAGSWIRDQMK
jgi:hypothetical protein